MSLRILPDVTTHHNFIHTPDEMKSQCVSCSNKSQHTVSVKCRYRPGYDNDKKVWTDLPAHMNITFCSNHLDIYLKNRQEHERKYGADDSCCSGGKDWWDILDGVPGLPEYA